MGVVTGLPHWPFVSVQASPSRPRGFARLRALLPSLGARRKTPEPPVEMPPGRIVHVPGRGEHLLRDSGGDGPPVLLLHGWMVSGDLNWFRTYEPLLRAGYRVLSVDHRGHGRGLRTPEKFRLVDCAADAAALVRYIGCGPVAAVGYSMGGPLAQLMARDHPDTVSSVVLCATATDWKDPRLFLFWRSMSWLRLQLGLFPTAVWRWGLRLSGFRDSPTTSWVAAEASRGSSRDVAEAGRELSRFDSRGWVARLGVPAAVVLTTEDKAVPPAKQRELARLTGAQVFEVEGDHWACTQAGGPFPGRLAEALGALGEAGGREPTRTTSAAA